MRALTRVIGGALTLSLLSQLAACGTVFYPDRRGQISGRIDPAIVIFDAIGLLFYVLPGVIAFGIDFASGAIYLPDDKTAQVDPKLLRKVIDANGEIDRVALKALIENQTGTSLPLDDPRLIQQRGSLQQLAAYGLQPSA